MTLHAAKAAAPVTALSLPPAAAASADDADAGEKYTVTFSGAPRRPILDYRTLREEVEVFLGNAKDPGIWTFKDGGCTSSIRSLRGFCNIQLCHGCTRALRAQYAVTLGSVNLTIKVRGSHGELQAPTGSTLWNIAEQHALAEAFPPGTRMTAQGVRDALAKSGLALRCGQEQLWQAVTRRNRTVGVAAESGNVTCLELQTAASQYAQGHDFMWESKALHDLVVVSGIYEPRVCVIFTCRGMLEKVRCAQGKVLKLMVDAKQKIVSNTYGILTLSFLVPSQDLSKTWASAGHRGKVREYTGTSEPFVQALLDTESHENVADVFRTACSLAHRFGGVDLEKQVCQVHKDFAKGIAKAKKLVFPAARTCDDYPHLARAAHSTMTKLLSGTAVAPPATQARQRGRKPKRSAAASGKAAATAGKPNQLHKDDHRSARAAVHETNPHVQRLMRLFKVTRMLPSLQLFDAIWRIVFSEMDRRGQHACLKYIKDTYFMEVRVANISKHLLCSAASPGHDLILFAGFWAGILGTYPGSGSGTQALESFHAYWQSLVQKEARPSPVRIFDVMQRLYKDTFAHKYAWGQPRTFGNIPKDHARCLINGAGLRSAGRSPAVDFWAKREQQLDGTRNYRKAFAPRSGQRSSVAGETTTVFVMATASKRGVAPSEQTVAQTFADAWVRLLVSEGESLQKALRDTHIVVDEDGAPSIDLGMLETFFLDHAAVLQGHLPDTAWPRFQRSTQERLPAQLCTCLHFIQHADCEHNIFVSALQGKVSLNNAPHQEPRGRKRKAT